MDYDGHTTTQIVNILPVEANPGVGIINGDFETEDGWVLGDAWSISTNLNIVAFRGTDLTPVNSTLYQAIQNIIPGNIYTINYTISKFIAPVDQFETIHKLFVSLGTQAGAEHTETGVFSIIFTAGVADNLLRFIGPNVTAESSETIDIDITDISITNGYTTEVIDTLGFKSLDYIIQTGDTVGGFDSVLEESDSVIVGSYTDVPSEHIIGENISYLDDETEVTKHVGTVGKKRFQHFKIINAKDINIISAFAVLKKTVSKDELA